MPLYTYYLSRGDYGYNDLIITAITLLIPVITFQIKDGLYRYLLGADEEKQKSKTISNVIFIVLKNLIIFNILYIIFICFISFKYDWLIFIQLNDTLIASIWNEISRGMKKNSIYSVSGVISTIVMVGCNIFCIIFLKLKVEALIISNIFSNLAIYIYIESKLKVLKHLNLKYNDPNLRKNVEIFHTFSA